MTETSKSLDVKHGSSVASGGEKESHGFEPFETLRQEIDRLFDTHLFSVPKGSSWRLPFGRSAFDFAPAWPPMKGWAQGPAVDIVESDKAYEITAELPGLTRENIDIQLSNDTLTIKGEKSEEREEKARNRYLTERRYGSFERMFRLPDGVDANRIDASFNKGVLKIVLPKTAEAQSQSKKIEVKEA